MIPVHCTIVPISSIASSLGAKNSYWFLVLVYIAFNLSQAVYLYMVLFRELTRNWMKQPSLTAVMMCPF